MYHDPVKMSAPPSAVIRASGSLNVVIPITWWGRMGDRATMFPFPIEPLGLRHIGVFSGKSDFKQIETTDQRL